MVASSTKPSKQATFSPGWRIPEAIRLTIRSLYVLQGIGPAQISEMVKLTPVQVRNLIAREGWRVQRAKKRNERETKQIAVQDARANEDIQRVVEATATLSEELSVGSLILSRELLEAKDAKGLQMASGAAANFVKIARMSRGLDNRQQDQGSSLNVFICRGEVVTKSEPRNVTPVASTNPIQLSTT